MERGETVNLASLAFEVRFLGHPPFLGVFMLTVSDNHIVLGGGGGGGGGSVITE